MKIPFNIKYRPQIESGEYKVETRDGRSARIICWEAKGCQPIIALICSAVNAEEEVVLQLHADGQFSSDEVETMYDLFIVTPEEELSVFEEGLNAFLFDFVHTTVDEDPIKYVKKNSNVLLSFARQQFIKDGYVIEKKAFHDAVENISDKHLAEMSVQYSIHCKIEDGTRHAVMNWDTFQKVAQKFIDIGKDETLKDLPKWKKVGLDTGQTTLMVGYTSDEDKLYRNGYVISLTDLEKLPK